MIANSARAFRIVEENKRIGRSASQVKSLGGGTPPLEEEQHTHLE